MRFIKTNSKEICNKRNRSKMAKFIMEFSFAGIHCAKVEDFTHAHAKSCASSISVCARRLGMPHIRGAVYGGECFIYNTLIKED